jgi:hypothetical protein
MTAIAEAARAPLQVYLVGGATAVVEGWRQATIDIDLTLGPGHDAVLRANPAIKGVGVVLMVPNLEDLAVAEAEHVDDRQVAAPVAESVSRHAPRPLSRGPSFYQVMTRR